MPFHSLYPPPVLLYKQFGVWPRDDESLVLSCSSSVTFQIKHLRFHWGHCSYAAVSFLFSLVQKKGNYYLPANARAAGVGSCDIQMPWEMRRAAQGVLPCPSPAPQHLHKEDVGTGTCGNVRDAPGSEQEGRALR